MNMLSAEKVKLHGIQDKRWTVHDKITQFKGLVNMFKRERKIVMADRHSEVKTICKQITDMSKKLKTVRDVLDKKTVGRHLLDNVLINHKAQRCAYRNLPPHAVIEAVTQSNYFLRKSLDNILYKRKQKSEELTDLKLKYGDMQDTSVSAVTVKIPVEIESSRVSDKLTNAVLLFQAAISVQTTYRDIIKILYKDSMYYDSLLNTLQVDILKQNQCMISLIKLGQIAVEYLDDRRNDYQNLDKAVKEARLVRKDDFEKAIYTLKRCASDIKLIIRKDDDLPSQVRRSIFGDDMYKLLLEEVEEADGLLRNMAIVVHCVNYDDIVPTIVEQREIQTKFSDFIVTLENRRKALTDGVEKAMGLYNYYLYHTNDFFHEYKARKKEIVEQIKETENYRNQCIKKKLWLTEKLAKTRLQLQSIESALKVVKLHDVPIHRASENIPPIPYLETDYGNLQRDVGGILKNILQKVKLIVDTPRYAKLEIDQLVEFRNFKIATAKMLVKKDVELAVVEEDEQPPEDVMLLRKIIKKRSAYIVEAAKALELK